MQKNTMNIRIICDVELDDINCPHGPLCLCLKQLVQCWVLLTLCCIYIYVFIYYIYCIYLIKWFCTTFHYICLFFPYFTYFNLHICLFSLFNLFMLKKRCTKLNDNQFKTVTTNVINIFLMIRWLQCTFSWLLKKN